MNVLRKTGKLFRFDISDTIRYNTYYNGVFLYCMYRAMGILCYITYA